MVTGKWQLSGWDIKNGKARGCLMALQVKFIFKQFRTLYYQIQLIKGQILFPLIKYLSLVKHLKIWSPMVFKLSSIANHPTLAEHTSHKVQSLQLAHSWFQAYSTSALLSSSSVGSVLSLHQYTLHTRGTLYTLQVLKRTTVFFCLCLAISSALPLNRRFSSNTGIQEEGQMNLPLPSKWSLHEF